MVLLFATHNEHKAREIRNVLQGDLQIITLLEAGITDEVPEPYETLEANASAKTRTIRERTGLDCFSEDTGLEVTALNGAPGVKSARYAGSDRSTEANMDKLLSDLAPHTDRSARFRTVISLLIGGQEFRFEGCCAGHILKEKRGSGGFGYDPIFIPEGSDRSFAEMDLPEKNRYSHRKKAVEKLVEFLNRYAQTT
ncbi:MAG: RdgB/HAM1 family non-canonical purine pyrophosphatase [Bacteroidota bacterium]|jgi:XTP/dITP diphosphohydrolase